MNLHKISNVQHPKSLHLFKIQQPQILNQIHYIRTMKIRNHKSAHIPIALATS